jgi:peroxiredoxin
VCHHRLAQLREKLASLKELDVQLLAVDPHELWSAKYLLKETGLETSDVNYPLLLDPTQTVSATYGVAFQMRIHTELSNRPATFIIDKTGVIRYARRAKTFGDRPSPSDIVEELKKL